MRPSELLRTYGFCRGTEAINADGSPVPHWDENAIAFCALGALARSEFDGTIDDFEFDVIRTYLQDKAFEMNGGRRTLVSMWNDASDADTVIAAFEEVERKVLDEAA